MSKKLVINTPVVVAPKMTARTPSSVDALRVVRRACLVIFCGGVVGSIGADLKRGSNISKAGEDKISNIANPMLI